MAELADATVLKEGIKRLNAFARNIPYVLSTFAALGDCNHIRACKLAYGGTASVALVEALCALDHAPDLEGAEATFNQLGDLLNRVIEIGQS